MKQARQSELGAALIIALVFTALAFVIAAALAAACGTAAMPANAQALTLRSRYEAESASTYAVWRLAADIKAHSNRSMGRFDGAETAEDNASRAVADGRILGFSLDEGSSASVQLLDANRGLDVSGNLGPSRARSFIAAAGLTPTDDTEMIRAWLARAGDYVDGDSLLQNNGMEQSDYSPANLPRNGALQSQWEVLWIPGFRDAMIPGASSNTWPIPEVDLLRIVPPRGQTFPGSDKPNFFSSPAWMISQLAQLESDELEAVIAARDAWNNSRIPISDTLGELRPKVERYFSMSESRIYELRCRSIRPDGLGPGSLNAVVDLSRGLPSSGSSGFKGLRWWSWRHD
ncbi:MAG: hypothetical protein RL095_3622 [Verrucomicrobiota bacterium]|jgi:hypothetical protein